MAASFPTEFFTFLITYKWQLLFYAGIIVLSLSMKHKLQMQGPFGLFKTNYGLPTMERLAKKYREWLRLVALTGIGAAVVGFFFIIFVILKHIWDLIFVPQTPIGVAPVIPGFPIPGLGVTLPLIIGWVALFILVTIHELAHGVIARVFDVKVRSSGILFLGLPIGAFVEPDEKQLQKQPDYVQYAIMAAGPVSNVLLAIIAWLLIVGAGMLFMPISENIIEQQGYQINTVINGTPADLAGLKPGMTITSINNITIQNTFNLTNVLSRQRPGDVLAVTANETPFAVVTKSNPNNPETAYLGINGATKTELKRTDFGAKAVYASYGYINEFLYWLWFLSLNIGIINLYPIFMTDGAQMMRVFMMRLIKDEKKALKYWSKINLFFLYLLIGLAVYGLMRWISGYF